MATLGHRQSASISQNHKAHLASAYNELGKELSSSKIRVVGNYTLGKVIGEGTYGKVRLGVHRLTGIRVAVKQIPKAMSASLTREIHHHRQLHHPHVTQLYEVIATENNIWLITELCSGGELFDYLAEKGRLTEEETRILFGQLCLAVAYVHDKGIVHRDLKLENVLLDEKCRVKLGDFGFTREFERGTLLETFCGTTGYASPEMLLAKKYLGPEVDVWSLGVILYTLLTGTLPFDDDDEAIMREKVIKGEFEDPEWLSEEARDLLTNILEVEPMKRLTIAQILAHTWFKLPSQSLSASAHILIPESRSSPIMATASLPAVEPTLASSVTSDSTFHSASSEFIPSTPTTPDDILVDVVEAEADDQPNPNLHRNASESTLKQKQTPELHTSSRKMSQVQEEEDTCNHYDNVEMTPIRPSLSRTTTNSRSSSRGPPPYPVRTPARTKRRSVSSTLSEPNSPLFEKSLAYSTLQDFSSLLSTPAPLIFSTPLERDLLNNLCSMGFDTGQIVHSVLTNACDATGAMWWMLKRKAEKRVLEEPHTNVVPGGTSVNRSAQTETEAETPRPQVSHDKDSEEEEKPRGSGHKKSASRSLGAVSREDKSGQSRSPIPPALMQQTQSAPELQLIPATPTTASGRPRTPPRAASPSNPLLSPISTTTGESFSRSHPNTPGGSLKEKDKDGLKGRKNRAGSVSIMQRATTALEAAGLVKKKSVELKEKDKNPDKQTDDSRSSHASSTNRSAKSPPLIKTSKDGNTTPPPHGDSQSSATQIGSPWVLTNPMHSPPPTPANTPGDSINALPTITENSGSGKLTSNKNRASLLSAFRFWFKDDPKGKRKETVPTPGSSPSQGLSFPHQHSPAVSPVAGRGRGTMKRRASNSGTRPKMITRKSNRTKRGSVSSRRSSSVNSKRSSLTGAQAAIFESYGQEQMVPVSRQRSDPSRRSFGSRTPNSEREEYYSRPSSIHSITAVQMPHRHHKSPSAGSGGSIHPGRTSSPLPKFHRRHGSGSSTRVVRQMPPTTPYKQSHLRSNSASSNQSLASSRNVSLYDVSEVEGRSASPIRLTSSRNSFDDTLRRGSHTPTTFVAQKRMTPFTNPGNSNYLHSFGRSSWKKSWGLEPPGWQTRTAQAPTIEVLAISPAVTPGGSAIRDVFTGRQSLGMGDESDWVDEEDDTPGYMGGLGQMFGSASSSSPRNSGDSPIIASPPTSSFTSFSHPRATSTRNTQPSPSKRSTNLTVTTSGRTGRSKSGGRSPAGRASPLPNEGALVSPPESRGGRRQLPNASAFKMPIQEEEEEGEEEE